MSRRKQVLVVGFGQNHCPEAVYKVAYEVGAEVAKRGALLLTGGLGGVMEAASRGAKEAGGFVIGIIPQDSKGYANEFCDAVVATGLGFARDFITAYSADAIVVVGGGAGTLIEVSAAYQKKIPTVAVAGTGGIADQVAGTFIDDRKAMMILKEDTAEKAVERALTMVNSM